MALQDQIFTKDLPLLKKIIPDLTFTAAFGRERYVCPRNLAALAASDDQQGDLLLYLDDEAVSGTKEERAQCARLEKSLGGYAWDGLRDHSEENISDSLWQRFSTDKANCLGSHCRWYRECPFFVARREIEQVNVVVANHALVMAAMPKASGASVSKWISRELREGQPHLLFHCAGIRVSDQLEKLLWRKIPHVVVTSRHTTLA